MTRYKLRRHAGARIRPSSAVTRQGNALPLIRRSARRARHLERHTRFINAIALKAMAEAAPRAQPWIVACIKHGHEFAAQDEAWHNGLPAWLPLTRQWQRRNTTLPATHRIERPALPGYLFLEHRPAELAGFLGKKGSLLLGILGSGEPGRDRSISAITGAELYRFADRMSETGATRIRPLFAIGEMVRITGGPLAGQIVETTAITGRSGTFLAQIFGGTRPVKIDLDMLENIR